MAKRIIVSFAIIIMSICCSVVCFAADDNSNVNLGDEIKSSIDKTGDSMRNVADDVMNGTDNSMRNSGMRGDNNNYSDNNVFTEGYNAVRTSVDDVTSGNMSTTTWMWIILAVAAIIIVAMVWYYATNNNDND